MRVTDNIYLQPMKHLVKFTSSLFRSSLLHFTVSCLACEGGSVNEACATSHRESFKRKQKNYMRALVELGKLNHIWHCVPCKTKAWRDIHIDPLACLSRNIIAFKFIITFLFCLFSFFSCFCSLLQFTTLFLRSLLVRDECSKEEAGNRVKYYHNPLKNTVHPFTS